MLSFLACLIPAARLIPYHLALVIDISMQVWLVVLLSVGLLVCATCLVLFFLFCISIASILFHLPAIVILCLFPSRTCIKVNTASSEQSQPATYTDETIDSGFVPHISESCTKILAFYSHQKRKMHPYTTYYCQNTRLLESLTQFHLCSRQYMKLRACFKKPCQSRNVQIVYVLFRWNAGYLQTESFKWGENVRAWGIMSSPLHTAFNFTTLLLNYCT